MSKSQKFNIGLCLAILAASTSITVCPSFADDDLTIGGRISDHAKEPVAGAQVRLLDQDGSVIKSTNCFSDGSFSISHKACGKCSLEIVPDEKTGLATALIENVAGDKNRDFVVELHQGFQVAGRVSADGKGLRGLTVKVTAVESENQHVHGGGYAKTSKDGRFHMTLTPGVKQLIVLNQRYPDMAADQSIQFTVTADVELPDIVLKPR
ncbi:MAG TPA: carboxypeptidase-like regulatory domain-containing protein [Planktothrix sp.]